MTAFSLMSPIGILIVVLTESNLKEDESMVLILLSAVASGTILYIVFFEILQRDRSKDKTKLTGLMLYLSMIVGFTAMVFITLKVVHWFLFTPLNSGWWIHYPLSNEHHHQVDGNVHYYFKFIITFIPLYKRRWWTDSSSSYQKTSKKDDQRETWKRVRVL